MNMARISAKGLSVSFPIYDLKGRSLRKDLFRIGTGGRIVATESNVFVSALEDISFSLNSGQRLGLIGHNGAGKTTLLKVLAGIYEPAAGQLRVEGNVAPLFDLMGGMDMDATGWENIRLRGILLGFTPRQIKAKMEEIAEFSDLGHYLSMPIRTYSAGMLVRLAFSISTSSQADILLMDEMIGAGDAAFISKAETRLKDFVKNASILVLATHAVPILRQWCTHAMLLHHGCMVQLGQIEDVLRKYCELIGAPYQPPPEQA
jgi:ABC-type polysaccharide/polyol phosphate transport system ATPase subunit